MRGSPRLGRREWKVRHVMVVLLGGVSVCRPARDGWQVRRLEEEIRKERQAAVCHGIDPVTSRPPVLLGTIM